MAKDQTMKALLSAIEDKEAEILRLQAQVEALREVYNLQAGITPQKKVRAARSNVKNTVFELLDKVGASGLNANIACEMAKAAGIDLNPKSVSSLLSRFAKDGALHYDNVRYRLPQFAPTTQNVGGHPNVRPLRTSGQSHDGF